jgi:two-component system, cell cycle sensor histidine kinase and response regulator CckA
VSTILFVDDHHAARTVYAEMLRNTGHVVLEAGTFADAEYLMERQRGGIDLLIVEAVLTTTNGLVVARRLKPLYPKMRVLFVSDQPAKSLSDEGLLPKRTQFLSKPIAAEDLAGKVRQLTKPRRVRKKASGAGSAMTDTSDGHERLSERRIYGKKKVGIGS